MYEREALLNSELEITQHQVAELTKERDRFKSLYEQERDDLRIASEMVGKLQDRRDSLAAALRPFADFYEGDLASVGGGTQVAPMMPVQFFKDAKAAMKLMDAKEG